MNTIAKGKRLENKAVEVLRGRGYKVFFKSIFVKFHQIDFAGFFDIVAAKNKEWLFVQVKSRKDKTQLEEIKMFQDQYAPLFTKCQMWVWNKKKKDFDIFDV
ncbi:MAG: hypothetical protein ACPLZ9_05295 [Candidatus Ratteibacteria bacterium]